MLDPLIFYPANASLFNLKLKLKEVSAIPGLTFYSIPLRTAFKESTKSITLKVRSRSSIDDQKVT